MAGKLQNFRKFTSVGILFFDYTVREIVEGTYNFFVILPLYLLFRQIYRKKLETPIEGLLGECCD